MREKIFPAMLAGRIDPFVAATQMVRQGSVSPTHVRAWDQSLRDFVITGVFISSESDAAIFSDGGNLGRIAERLGRYNYHAATLISTDKDLIADVAFTLFQIMESSPANLEEHVKLLEEFYRSIGDRHLPPSALFRVNYRAMETYSKLSQANKEYYRDTLRFGLEALRYSEEPSVRGSGELCYVYFWLGVSLNEIGRGEVEQLDKSVRFLKRCVEDTQHCRGRFLGSALNSLGYSLLLLGRLKHEPQTVKEAIATLKRALPYRTEDRERRRTEANLETAARILAGGTVAEADPSREGVIRRIEVAEQAFVEVISERLKGETRESLLKAGMDHLLDAASRSDAMDEPYLRARLELALGIGLVFSGDTAVAVCFLRAAARKWDVLDTSDSLPRRTAAYYNLGLAFSAMQGLRSKDTYVNLAIEIFEHAMGLFAELGSDERVQVCATLIENLKRRVDEV